MPIIIDSGSSPTAIIDYASLQTGVADWANRSDLTSRIPDFIAFAESRLYDMLILRDTESDEPLTLTLNQNYVALPTSFISPIAFWLVVDSARVPLNPALPQELPYYTDSTQPRYWAVDGDNVRFDCPADSAYSAYLRCVKKSHLSASNTTNHLLSRRPDLYLGASLVELARYTRDAELFNTWEPRVLKAMAEVKAADSRARGMVPMRTDIGIRRRSSSILRG